MTAEGCCRGPWSLTPAALKYARGSKAWAGRSVHHRGYTLTRRVMEHTGGGGSTGSGGGGGGGGEGEGKGEAGMLPAQRTDPCQSSGQISLKML